MKQFKTVFGFEFKNYVRSKVFIGLTLFLVLVMAVIMFFPRIKNAFAGGEEAADEPTGQPAVLLLFDENGAYPAGMLEDAILRVNPAFVIRTPESADAIGKEIEDGAADYALVVKESDVFDFYVKNKTLYDSTGELLRVAATNALQTYLMQISGVDAGTSAAVLSANASLNVVAVGQDQTASIGYTYVMIYALYMVILIYGQMVANSVAGEKGSRAMEVLVTSVRPNAMIFGKVLATTLAGLIQIVAVFGSAILFYRVNASAWGDNPVIASFFNIPGALFGYMILFFLLGFVMYAFLFSAVGSTVSKPEEINMAVTPVMLLFISGFIVTILSISFGSTENIAIKIMSFLPFASPMAMFTRIAMGSVPGWQIGLCVGILVLSVWAVGVLSAKIYRTGILLYGNKPGLGSVLKAMRRA